MHTSLIKMILYFYIYHSSELPPEPNKHLNTNCKKTHMHSFKPFFPLWGFNLKTNSNFDDKWK